MKCSRCGREFDGAISDLCPRCRALPKERKRSWVKDRERSLAKDRQKSWPPWERRRELGFWRGMGETIMGVFLDPSRSFADMRTKGGLGDPLLYAVILGTIGGVFGSVVWRGGINRFLTLLEEVPAEEMAMNSLKQAMYALSIPLIVILYLFISSGMHHLFLKMAGGAEKGFETTFRVVSYAYGSTATLQIVPSCGGLIAIMWLMVCEIVGLRQAHGTSSGKAAVAVLVPLVVCCGGSFSLFWGTKLAIFSALRNYLP